MVNSSNSTADYRPLPPSPPRAPGFATRLAMLYAALFVMSGVQLPFFPVWLKVKGLDADMIGLVLAAPIVARVLALPLVTRAADRRDAVRMAIVATSCVTIAGYVLVALCDAPLAILLAFALASLAMTPVMPLTETYALRGLSARGRAYGPVRLWGSLAFIVGTFAAGLVADMLPARYLIWLIVAASVAAAIAAFRLLPLSTGAPAGPGGGGPPVRLLRSKAFIAVVAAASFIQASHAVFYAFSAVAWRAAGLNGSAIAALWGLGVLAEIVLFALSGRLPAYLTPGRMLTIGAAAAVVRWSVMAFDPPTMALPALQLLHALTFGATHLGALTYLARHTPAGQAAQAQGYLALAIGAAMAGATALSGVLYGAFGAQAYAAMALAAIAGGVCAGIAQRAAREPAL